MGAKVILFILSLILTTNPVLAGNPPTLSNPTNNSTVTASKLEWQTPAYPICLSHDAYRVQIASDPTFSSSSIYRNIYTKNTYYTPQLPTGTWHWRIMVRDETCGNWSDWSNIWSFILISSTPTPASTPPATPSPSPSPISSQSSTSSFTISDIPQQINSDQSFKISVNLALPNNKNVDYFLSGAFKKTDAARYFGLTKISANWVKYESSNYSNQFKITTDNNGVWTGTLEVKPDTEDSNYKGTGDYIFKVSRYTVNGSQSWSNNEVTVNIVSTSNNQDELSTSVPTSDAPPPTSSKTSTTKKTSPQAKASGQPIYRIASVAAATASAELATPDVNIKVEKQKEFNPIVLVGLIFIFAGLGLIGYITYIKKKQGIK